MTGALAETTAVFHKARQLSSRGLVAYSGGKDSNVVMDIASRTFDTVEAFFMYIVPGLECNEIILDAAKRRWKNLTEIRQYPHWLVPLYMTEGVFCFEKYGQQTSIPQVSLMNIYAIAMLDANVPFVLTGAKRVDGIWRRRFMNNMKRKDAILSPLAGWNRFEVISYLKRNGIHVSAAGTTQSSAAMGALDSISLLWLYDHFPRDFVKVCDYFPFAEAVVWHRRWYG